MTDELFSRKFCWFSDKKLSGRYIIPSKMTIFAPDLGGKAPANGLQQPQKDRKTTV